MSVSLDLIYAIPEIEMSLNELSSLATINCRFSRSASSAETVWRAGRHERWVTDLEGCRLPNLSFKMPKQQQQIRQFTYDVLSSKVCFTVQLGSCRV